VHCSRRLSIGLLWAVLAAAAPPAVAELVLIAHPAVSAGPLSLNSSRRMFSMQLDHWSDGTPVRVFVLPDDDPRHRAFAKDRLRLFPRQLRRVWDRQLYSGTGQAPEIVTSEVEMRRRVAQTPGAIGYLSSENLDESVKALDIR
jgi:hypothetical protein